jgi:hypothetical protein
MGCVLCAHRTTLAFDPRDNVVLYDRWRNDKANKQTLRRVLAVSQFGAADREDQCKLAWLPTFRGRVPVLIDDYLTVAQVEEGILPFLANNLCTDDIDLDGSGVVVRVRIHPETRPSTVFNTELPLYEQIIDGHVFHSGKVSVHLFGKFELY